MAGSTKLIGLGASSRPILRSGDRVLSTNAYPHERSLRRLFSRIRSVDDANILPSRDWREDLQQWRADPLRATGAAAVTAGSEGMGQDFRRLYGVVGSSILRRRNGHLPDHLTCPQRGPTAPLGEVDRGAWNLVRNVPPTRGTVGGRGRLHGDERGSKRTS
jgi:hypothetical protein